MIPLEFRGKYTSCKVFTENVEPHAVAQIYEFLNCEAFDGCQIRVMPDVHSGKGAVIGFTSPLNDKVIPHVIGVDIGCGVTAVALDSSSRKVVKAESVLPEFDQYLRKHVPSGFTHRERPSPRCEWLYKAWFGAGSDWDGFEKAVNESAVRMGLDPSGVWRQPGSLGGGNHFIEIGKGGDGQLWLVVHSGSRNFGLQVATFHQKKAVAAMGRRGGLEWLEGQDAQSYLRDMRVAQKFAMMSRLVMLDVLLDFFDLKIKNAEFVNSTHNFIGDDDVIRKGAISAKLGEQVIIPWNMRDGIVMGVGKGNADWNTSAPHGAGRAMSRSAAKQLIPMADYKATMEAAGVWTSCISQGTLDESPQAYKPTDEILACIGETVEVTDKLQTIYNFKAGGEDRPKWHKTGKADERPDKADEKPDKANGTDKANETGGSE